MRAPQYVWFGRGRPGGWLSMLLTFLLQVKLLEGFETIIEFFSYCCFFDQFDCFVNGNGMNVLNIKGEEQPIET